MNNLAKSRRSIAKGIRIMVYITFISYVIADLSLFIDLPQFIKINISLFYLPFRISKGLLPIWLIAWVYFAYKSIDMVKIKSELSDIKTLIVKYRKKLIHLSFLVTVCLLFLVMLSNIAVQGCFIIQDKHKDPTGYFIQIDNKQLRCNQSVYSNIIKGEAYAVTYVGNALLPKTGIITKVFEGVEK